METIGNHRHRIHQCILTVSVEKTCGALSRKRFVLLEAFMAPLRIFGCLIVLGLCFSQNLEVCLPPISLIRCETGAR